MLKSYEALLDHGQIRWLETPPDLEEARVIVTVLPATRSEKPAMPGHTAAETDQLLASTAGAWGRHTLSEVKALMAKQRQADWGDS